MPVHISENIYFGVDGWRDYFDTSTNFLTSSFKVTFMMFFTLTFQPIIEFSMCKIETFYIILLN